jgi:outer membrane protein assembly factor BamB
MKLKGKNNRFHVLVFLSFAVLFQNCSLKSKDTPEVVISPDITPDTISVNIDTIGFQDSIIEAKSIQVIEDSIDILIGTYLGNEKRNYYGDKAPKKLSVKWKLNLGKGKSMAYDGPMYWRGAGWTGQPLIVKEKDSVYLIQGAFDYNLKKINAENGRLVWEYTFDDILKGTGSIWKRTNPGSNENRLMIMQGSRYGLNNNLKKDEIPSFRAVSYITGKEIWRMDSRKTKSYSRDVDASPLVVNDTAFIGLENGIFTVFNPDEKNAVVKNGKYYPEVISEHQLFEERDAKSHHGNLVAEASPALLGNRIYVPTGAGHLYGYSLDSGKVDWDLYLGADMDGSPVVTSDSCLIITLERQYIKGNGGVMKIDPSKSPDESVVWFFPTPNVGYAEWKGGVIGSASINDTYVSDTCKKLAAFNGIDGYVYVVSHQNLDQGKEVKGPNKKKNYATPELVFKYRIGPSISTPIFTKNTLVAGGYRGLYLFEYNPKINEFSKMDYRKGNFEATPVVYNENLFIASRDGYLYCFGDKTESPAQLIAEIPDSKMETIEEKKPEQKQEPIKIEKEVAQKKETVSQDHATEANDIKSLKRYKLIMGSFRTKDRAERYNSKLEAEGFAVKVYGPYKDHYYNIAESYDRKSTAYNKANKIRDEKSKEIWVMKDDI